MATERSQTGRLATIGTSLRQDQVVLERFSMRSRLGEPFLISAEVLAETPVDFFDALYQPVVIRTTGLTGIARCFHGLLFAVERLDDGQTTVRYRLTVRSWLDTLRERSNVRIFQHKTIQDILQEVFQDAGCSDFDLSGITGQYPMREYCTQYRETDFNFVSRLMEEEGIYYFFRHEDDRHTLVASDGPAAHEPSAETPTVDFMPPGSNRSRRRVNIWRWAERIATAPTEVMLGEHHFLKPRDANRESVAASEPPSRASAKLYDHPADIGGLDESGVFESGKAGAQAKRRASIMLQAARAASRRFVGEGDAFGVNSGDRLTLAAHPEANQNGDYLIVGATHSFASESYRSDGPDDYHIDVMLEAVPFSVRWRPERLAARPRTQGPQTARVVGPLVSPGPTDDTIHVDKHGRVKVQFFWDREGGWKDDSSCWVRVSQGWADGGFGAVMLPRIGQEVIVDFLDGDPDRPIITGRVYNADKTPPYPLPQRKTVSTIKSRTVGKAGSYPEAEEPPGAGDPGFNELRFEDAGGKEEVFLHAQRDRKAWVRFDDNEKVGRDQVGRIGRNRSTAVKKNVALVIEEGDEKREITRGSRKTTIKGDDKETIQSGDYSLKVSSGKATIEAAQSIELKVAKTSIKLTPQGITMTGLTIAIDAKTTLSAKGGLTTEVKGGLSLTLNGAIVMIN